MIDQMRLVYKIAHLTIGKARTVATFITDGITDLPKPDVTEYLVTQFRSSAIPCCFVCPAQRSQHYGYRNGVAPSTYFAHIVNFPLMENISLGTNGTICFVRQKQSNQEQFSVSNDFIDHLLRDNILCRICQPFDSPLPTPQVVKLLWRKVCVSSIDFFQIKLSVVRLVFPFQRSH